MSASPTAPSLQMQQLRQAWQARKVVWLLCLLLLALVVWASWAPLDEVVVGSGKVIPSRSVQKVQSLEGGILKYFEETGGPHYQGACFVFDQREALDAGLAPSTEVVRPASEAHREAAALRAKAS